MKDFLGVKLGVVLLVALALALPASAAARAGSTCQAYNPQLCLVAGQTQAKADGTAATTLPFTGLDLGLLAAGGCALLGGGMLVRRLSRQPE